MYISGWPFRPALILSPIEHFEIASVNKIFLIVIVSLGLSRGIHPPF
jgi:hypothetical protein